MPALALRLQSKIKNSLWQDFTQKKLKRSITITLEKKKTLTWNEYWVACYKSKTACFSLFFCFYGLQLFHFLCVLYSQGYWNEPQHTSGSIVC